MNLNGRLKRLEAQLPPQPETEYTLADFANEVLKAIADGLIEDYSDKPPSDFWDYSGMTSPTLADNLSEEDRSYGVGIVAGSTGSCAPDRHPNRLALAIGGGRTARMESIQS